MANVPTKSVYKNIAFTYLAKEGGSSKGVLVLLDGLPSQPGKKDSLMINLHSRKYDVFFPRYEGTWESEGEFLQRNPADAIKEFIEQLKFGLDLSSHIFYTAKKIFLLGASFGGGLALSLANNSNVYRVCALSPVISFKKTRGIETLENYLIEAYPKTYRFKPNRWQILINDDFYDLGNEMVERPENVLVIGGSNDNQISTESLKNYAQRARIKLIIQTGGHITLSKIDDQLLDIIDCFLKK